MKSLFLIFAMMTTGMANSAEVRQTELRPITKLGEFATGDTVKVKSGLRLVSARGTATLGKSEGRCTVTMEGPAPGLDAVFESDSEWKVKKTFAIASTQYLILENADNTINRELKVLCPQEAEIEELKKINLEVLSANRSVQVLRIIREQK